MNSIRYLVCRFHRKQSLIGAVQRAGFKSKYSLDKIYPNSTLDITTTPQLPQEKDDFFSGFIPVDKLTIRYSGSSGPGGQNVNKVNTKVDLRFHVLSATWIPESAKEKFIKMYNPLINKDGYLVMKSDKTRFQTLNVADCLDKVRFMVREAQKTPAEPSVEDLTTELQRHEASARSRLREKRIRSELKRSRSTEDF